MFKKIKTTKQKRKKNTNTKKKRKKKIIYIYMPCFVSRQVPPPLSLSELQVRRQS
jgi:hypothetical protein